MARDDLGGKRGYRNGMEGGGAWDVYVVFGFALAL